MKKISLVIIVIIVLVALLVNAFKINERTTNEVQAIIYKSPTCGCCIKYIPYLESKGFNIDVRETMDLDSIKSKYGIPHNMESCHTLIVKNYFVEGHVPIEAINKLLTEKPDIDGISLPNMPSGSPGMPGDKYGDFIIYSIKDGESLEFMVI